MACITSDARGQIKTWTVSTNATLREEGNCSHSDDGGPILVMALDEIAKERTPYASQEVSTVTLCLLRALTECAPAFITTYIIQPFSKPRKGSLAALSFEDISALFSKGIRREQEGAFEDYKADIHYRCLRMTVNAHDSSSRL